MAGSPERLDVETEWLIGKYIRLGKKDPIAGATIGRTGPEVWRIIRFWIVQEKDVGAVLSFFDLRNEEAFTAVLTYYEKPENREIIDAKIEACAPIKKN